MNEVPIACCDVEESVSSENILQLAILGCISKLQLFNSELPVLSPECGCGPTFGIVFGGLVSCSLGSHLVCT